VRTPRYVYGMRIRILVAAALGVIFSTIVEPSCSAAADGSLTGDWSGDSVCVANRETCHDEKALYHLTGPNEQSIVTVIGTKIVDGREIVMGPPSDFRYDPEKKTLMFESRYGTFRFTVSGTSMDGTLTLPSGVLLRRITLKKTPKAN
jgi:hypothetical protein